MAVISIANAKGGAGKTTVALLLAMEFAHRGEPVVVLDCDTFTYAANWLKLTGTVENITISTGITFVNLAGKLRDLRPVNGHVIIDLSSASDALVALAAGLSDLVIVPVQGCMMDAQGATHVLDLVRRVEQTARGRIDHVVLLTRVNPLVTTRAMRSVKVMLAARDLDLLDTPIVERSPYRDMFECGGSLYDMPASRGEPLRKAVMNMQLFGYDVATRLARSGAISSLAPFARLCFKTAPAAAAPRLPATARDPHEPAAITVLS
jgi:chromosome partitioning protein